MKRSQKTAIFILIVVLVAGAVLLYNHMSTKRDQPVKDQGAKTQHGGARNIPVEIYLVDYVKLDEGQKAVGTLVANEEIDVASEVAGKIEHILFAEGSRIKKGQALAKVNDDDLQSQLKKAIFERNMLKEKLDRSRILLESDAISREAFDQAETDYNMIEADIQLLQVRIDKTSIKAPFDGVVGFRYVSPGSYVQPGTKIAHMVDYSKLKVEFFIPERHYTGTLQGSTITFSTQNDPRERHATVYAIDPSVDPLTRNMTMRAIYDNASMQILPGMAASVVIGRKSGTSLQVPTEAIVPDADQKSVWIVRNGKAHAQHVITGMRTENMIEVRDGLAVGDSVVVTGLMQIKEGAPLLINR